MTASIVSDPDRPRQLSISALQETEDIHPLVGSKLEMMGYAVRHEVVLSRRLRVDFVAQKQTEALLVEAKTSFSAGILPTIDQIRRYLKIYPVAAVGVVAAPGVTLTSECEAIYLENQIRILSVEPDLVAIKRRRELEAIRGGPDAFEFSSSIASEFRPDGSRSFQLFAYRRYKDRMRQWALDWHPDLFEISGYLLNDFRKMHFTRREAVLFLSEIRELLGIDHITGKPLLKGDSQCPLLLGT